MLAQVAVDASASMAYRGNGAGIEARVRAAARGRAGASRLGQGDAVGLVTFDDALRDYLPPRGGRLHLRRILVSLDASWRRRAARPCGTALRRAIDLLKRRGLLVLVSDLYDDGEGVEAELRRAVRIGHEVAVFHVLTPDEIALPFRR